MLQKRVKKGRRQTLTVDELRMGRGVRHGLDKELRNCIVVTMPGPWQAVKANLTDAAAEVVFVESVERTALDRLLDKSHSTSAVVGVGGGMALDAANEVSRVESRGATHHRARGNLHRRIRDGSGRRP